MLLCRAIKFAIEAGNQSSSTVGKQMLHNLIQRAANAPITERKAAALGREFMAVGKLLMMHVGEDDGGYGSQE